MNNFLPKLFRDPLTAAGGLASALPFVGAGIGAVEAGLGIIQGIGQKKKINGLVGQLTPLTIPDQVSQILNLNLSNAQGDLQTQNYETQNLDNAFSQSLGSATRLGANPNDLSALFQQKINGVMQIGEQTHQSRTAAFSSLIGSLQNTADYNVAEQVSKNDIIKNKIQAAQGNLTTATNNVSGGINTALSSLSSKVLGNLYKTNNSNSTAGTPVDDFGTQLNKYLLSNSINNQLSGGVTGQDMQNSAVQTNSNNTFG